MSLFAKFLIVFVKYSQIPTLKVFQVWSLRNVFLHFLCCIFCTLMVKRVQICFASNVSFIIAFCRRHILSNKDCGIYERIVMISSKSVPLTIPRECYILDCHIHSTIHFCVKWQRAFSIFTIDFLRGPFNNLLAGDDSSK